MGGACRVLLDSSAGGLETTPRVSRSVPLTTTLWKGGLPASSVRRIPGCAWRHRHSRGASAMAEAAALGKRQTHFVFLAKTVSRWLAPWGRDHVLKSLLSSIRLEVLCRMCWAYMRSLHEDCSMFLSHCCLQFVWGFERFIQTIPNTTMISNHQIYHKIYIFVLLLGVLEKAFRLIDWLFQSIYLTTSKNKKPLNVFLALVDKSSVRKQADPSEKKKWSLGLA